MESMKRIFGIGIFDDGSFNGDFQEDGVCINLVEMIEGYGIDLKDIFSPKRYK